MNEIGGVVKIPGLVDLQINGYAGFDLNEERISTEKVKLLVHSLWAEGVTTFCPTLITAPEARIAHALLVIRQACESDPLIDATIRAIHLEGPFISAEDGPRGAHPFASVRAPDWTLFESWQRISGNRIGLITLSPEWPEAEGFIREAAVSGVVVSIGHTAAASDRIRQAVASGASLSTHLGNGCHMTLPRHPNYIWAQLAEEGLYASVIADGHHLPDEMLKVAYKVKGEKLILVSDSVHVAGMSPGTYETFIGGKVVLCEDGRLHMEEDRRFLAGSSSNLRQCVEYIAGSGIADFNAAIRMATLTPARLMGWKDISGDGDAKTVNHSDYCLVRWDPDKRKITVKETWKQGTLVYRDR